MEPFEVDDVDRQLLTLLQEDARYAATDLAERIGVSDNTVHNRMNRLEEAGVIEGYHARVDHERAGLSLFFVFTCTVRISEREAIAKKALSLPSVIEVTELMTGQRNLLIKVLGAEDQDISAVATRLDQLDLEINDESLVRAEHTSPLDYVTIRDHFEAAGADG